MNDALTVLTGYESGGYLDHRTVDDSLLYLASQDCSLFSFLTGVKFPLFFSKFYKVGLFFQRVLVQISLFSLAYGFLRGRSDIGAAFVGWALS